MGSGISMIGDLEKTALLFVVGVNIVVFVQLVAKGSSVYVKSVMQNVLKTLSSDDYEHDGDSRADLRTQPQQVYDGFTDARLRLNAIWAVCFVIAVAAAIKLVLPESLADQIIAAWFVGQGFALQPYVKSYLSGIQVRNNVRIRHRMCNPREWDIHYEPCKEDLTYNLVDQDILSFTLQARSSTKDVRVLPWTAVDNIRITRAIVKDTDV